MKRPLGLSLLLLASPFALAQGAAEPPTQATLSLDTDIAAVVASLESERPARTVVRSNVSIDSQRGTPPVLSVREYELLAPNLWQTRAFTTVKDGGIESTTLSLCGIVDLLSITETQVKFVKRYFLLAIGAAPLPFPIFSIPISRQATSKARASSLLLGTNGMKVCSPLPGSTFSFDIATEVQTARKSTFLADSEKVLKNAFQWSCVAGQLKPLADLVSGQDDQYLPVTCTLNNKDKGVSSEAEFAYLPAAKLYLRLSTKSSTFQSLTELKSVAYE